VQGPTERMEPSLAQGRSQHSASLEGLGIDGARRCRNPQWPHLV
jgi:hypothetical protein